MKKSLGVLVMAIVVCSSLAPAAQRRIQDQSPPPYVPGNIAGPSGQSSLTPQFPMQRPDDESMNPMDLRKGLAIARNKEIRQETDKLLQLAAELKKSVDASVAGDMLSLQAIKKTDEIEKLAKSVRGKMKQTYSEAPSMGR